MAIHPSELPSFESFVKSTKLSLRPNRLPERCSNCTASDATHHLYEIVDLHRHSSEDATDADTPHYEEHEHPALWTTAPQDSPYTSSPTSSSSSSAVTSPSTSSGEDHEDCVMTECESELASRPSASRTTTTTLKKKETSTIKKMKKTYLTEQQRYEIVCHVLSGEKQVHVAKEYGVTRAAVCYLVKHHAEIMHRVLTGHANYCCQRQRQAETSVSMEGHE